MRDRSGPVRREGTEVTSLHRSLPVDSENARCRRLEHAGGTDDDASPASTHAASAVNCPSRNCVKPPPSSSTTSNDVYTRAGRREMRQGLMTTGLVRQIGQVSLDRIESFGASAASIENRSRMRPPPPGREIASDEPALPCGGTTTSCSSRSNVRRLPINRPTAVTGVCSLCTAIGGIIDPEAMLRPDPSTSGSLRIFLDQPASTIDREFQLSLDRATRPGWSASVRRSAEPATVAGQSVWIDQPERQCFGSRKPGRRTRHIRTASNSRIAKRIVNSRSAALRDRKPSEGSCYLACGRGDNVAARRSSGSAKRQARG